MTLQINTNVAALNAQRNLGRTNRTLGGLFEQLSSGMRVNRAADDAAGLAISEKMRAQIRGMRQGQRNAQDGISMLQTAEGALGEVHGILQRVRELAIQAGNTTLSSSDRAAIGEEMLALRSEVDNISNRTRFNGQQLLTGALAVTLDGAASTADTVTSTANGATVSVASIDVSRAESSSTYNLANTGAVLTASVTTSGYTRSETFTVQDMGANATQAIDFEQLGITINVAHDANAGNVTGATIATAFNGTTAVTTASSSAIFRVGAEVGDDVALSFQDMRASALGSAGNKLSTLIADNSAVSTSAKADTLVTSIDEAIEQVSTFRAQLGAAQNQMETAVNSLAVSVENLSASESRIRDADIAQVSSELVAKQIMQQAGVSVLSQANTAPQAVLSLLQQ
ncbi:MAG: flagellin [Dehalococcoidia bacterium]|nr:flagellin [Dehalococcoidia bacterium]MCA9849211.1 flagellin [Dehalococcoidia bacterium]MCB9483252.1 flagellin [Dehalococcoidia bacterium]MCB9492297.1 flagellin [Dehalococcoidia bacterium]